ncbi:helix-hairpin-helix domain-containing protein [Cocleimonas sp. KMM 6892]|uniref:helix-hairpin-helix domain-containing protein n=1 Tax=unclassified Cocleimonas TaxID=2639732 RepID=UPI002DBA7341|nr:MULTISPECIES: helix-hairpin-helix domain-containing protein [unclassified Cocleimonas]MEB8432224.1 helix-hairpin-helix domain-containing protein [Cocleimonas sp. KMM 6892]MEC4714690.1 helix-hairpin-helix domain-containing protein [Cocleimonas sp. KMM 6895]MEC4744496.1 helix-hairpin-helix domain-containing protein [Cocleimonas sp. KMM 6896]
MFNNDVTKNYNNQDATGEILVMLVGAFLLGCLLCWLFKKLFSENDGAVHSSNSSNLSANNYKQSIVSPKVEEPKYVPQTTGEVRIIKSNDDRIYSKPRIDELTKISGITPEVQTILKQEGVNSFTDLRDIKRETLQSLQERLVTNNTNRKEIETWPHQASLASKGDWNKLKEYQAFISRSQKASLHVNTVPPIKPSDDLKVIEGIGPRIEEILYSKGITTFQQLSNSDTDVLKSYIVEADSRFNKNETESWPHQAAMAEKGQWEELNIYQEFMHSETTINTDAVTSSDNSSTKNTAQEVANNDDIKDYDDLKKIEGIGPKIEELLNKSGIYTFSQLHNSNQERLKSILAEAGNPYSMHSPETWPHQAGMAHNNDWKGLTDYQKSLQDNSTEPSVDVVIITKDDLKKIEGIGPKIQELLGKSGIHTFKDLSEQQRDTLKNLLDEGGPQYRVHEPESWPQQAKLASEGKWDELQKFQDELIGGRK